MYRMLNDITHVEKKRKATSANSSASAKQRNKRTSTEENAVVDAEQGRDEDERSDADAHDDENEERVEHEDTGEAEEACDSFHIVEENYPSKHGGSVSVRESTRGIQRPSLAECTAKLTKKEIEALNDSFKLAHPSIQDNQLGEMAMRAVYTSSASCSTVKIYINALIALWRLQDGKDEADNPLRACKPILDAFRKLKFKKARDEYVDKGIDLYYNSYVTIENLQQLAHHYLSRNSFEGIRDGCAQFMGIAGLFRSDEQLSLQLSDLYSRTFQKQGPTPCEALVVSVRQGKTNTHGKAEDATMMRNADPLLCPLAWLNLFFFCRFHHKPAVYPDTNPPTSFPSLQRREHWYDLPLLSYASDPTKAIGYGTQREAVKAAIDFAGIKTTKVTHISRRTGAQLAEINGADEDAIKRAGRWSSGVVESSYLTKFPMAAIRAIAGWNPQGGDFYLARYVEVPESLQKKLYPWVDQWIEELEKRPVNLKSRGPSHNLKDEDQSDMTGLAFCYMMRTLRKLFWQDIVYYRAAFPKLFLWNDVIFEGQDFLEFESRSLVSSRPEVEFGLEVQRILPVLCGQLTGAHAALRRLFLEALTRLDSSAVKLDTLLRQVSDLQAVNSCIFERLNKPDVRRRYLADTAFPGHTPMAQLVDHLLQRPDHLVRLLQEDDLRAAIQHPSHLLALLEQPYPGVVPSRTSLSWGRSTTTQWQQLGLDMTPTHMVNPTSPHPHLPPQLTPHLYFQPTPHMPAPHMPTPHMPTQPMRPQLTPHTPPQPVAHRFTSHMPSQPPYQAPPSSSFVASAPTHFLPDPFATSPFASAPRLSSVPRYIEPYRYIKVERVDALWIQYERGLGGYMPALQAFENRNVVKTGADMKCFQRRRPIYRAIVDLSKRMNIPCLEAAIKLEGYRVSRNLHIHSFAQHTSNAVEELAT